MKYYVKEFFEFRDFCKKVIIEESQKL
jgi:hypothetical protein